MESTFLFRPKDAFDEMRIYRPTPVVWSNTSAVLVNNFGVTLFRTEGDAIPLELPDGDEVLVGPDGVIYACKFGDTELIVKTYRYERETFRLDQEFRTRVILGLDPENLVILGVPNGIELWLDSSDSCLKLWSVVEGSVCDSSIFLVERPHGNLVFSSGQILGFTEDCGVRGMRMHLVDLATRRSWHISSSFAFTALDRVFAVSYFNPASDEARHGLHVFKDGDASFLELDGPVLEVGGNPRFASVTIFDGTDAQLYSVTENSNGTLVATSVAAHPGYKSLSPDGRAYAVRGFTDVLTVVSADPRRQVAKNPGRPILSHRYALGSSEYVLSRASTEVVGTVIHFHGGPESQEVPEGRFFGLPQWCNKHGLDWIGINYQGSLMPDAEHTRTAWRRWRSALSEDLLGALDFASGPVVLMGWSFGATIALALGAASDRIKGLLLGAVTGDLVKHAQYADSLDVEHHYWFSRRFDLKGDDGLFFNGLNGLRPGLQVLEFHGENDVNCPVFLANDVARQWEEHGTPWQQVWLPGGEHYASTPEDVELIFKSTRRFLTDVLIDQKL